MPENPPVCPYCHNPSALVTGAEIYPHRPDLHHKRFFECSPCNAYVGCHRDGTPLGRLANPELRAAKQAAHAAFDPLWKTGKKSRADAYTWLSLQMGIPPEDCHVGMFDVKTCKKVVEIMRNPQ